MLDLKQWFQLEKVIEHYLTLVPQDMQDDARVMITGEVGKIKHLWVKLLVAHNFVLHHGSWRAIDYGVDTREASKIELFNQYTAWMIRLDQRLERSSTFPKVYVGTCLVLYVIVAAVFMIQCNLNLLLVLLNLLDHHPQQALISLGSLLWNFLGLNVMMYLVFVHASCLSFADRLPFLARLMDSIVKTNPEDKRIRMLDWVFNWTVWLAAGLARQTIGNLSQNKSEAVRRRIRELTLEGDHP